MERRQSRAFGRGPNKPKPILDLRTGKEYRSEGEAGRALAKAVNGDPKNRYVWFDKVLRVLGKERFQTKNSDGEWVPLNHPSVE